MTHDQSESESESSVSNCVFVSLFKYTGNKTSNVPDLELYVVSLGIHDVDSVA